MPLLDWKENYQDCSTIKSYSWVKTKCDKGLHCLAYSTSHKEVQLLLLAVTLCSVTATCSVLSSVPLTEPVPLPDRGEERRGREDPAGERGRGVEGLLWRRVPGDCGWVRHEIRSGVHLSGYDVSTTLIYGLSPRRSVNVSFGRVEGRRRWEKESRRRRGAVKMSPQQNQS